MGIAEWPADQRPREKLLESGAAALSDSELIAIFLRTGFAGCSALELGQAMLRDHGGIQGLLSLPAAEFCRIKGVGTAKYVQLQAALELACRYLWQQARATIPVDGPQATRRFLQVQFAPYQHEVFACIWLDNQHQVIRFEELFRGTIDVAAVYPREVVKQAINLNAAAVIFAHNHPSGCAEPSAADRQITDRLKQALGLIDVRLLDHFVVGREQLVSFAERGLL